jgi:outer membrane protein OmpA-like peptidoglycan-associated protein
MRLADRRVSGRQQHGGPLLAWPRGDVHEGGDVHARKALEDQLLDAEAVARERAHDARVQRRALAGQAADRCEQRAPQLRLQLAQLGLALDRIHALAAPLIEGPGAIELLPQVGRDARASLASPRTRKASSAATIGPRQAAPRRAAAPLSLEHHKVTHCTLRPAEIWPNLDVDVGTVSARRAGTAGTAAEAGSRLARALRAARPAAGGAGFPGIPGAAAPARARGADGGAASAVAAIGGPGSPGPGARCGRRGLRPRGGRGPASGGGADERGAAAGGSAQQQAEAAKKEAGSAREAAAQAQAEADRIRKRAEAEVNRLEAALGQIAETRRTQLGLILNLGSDHLKFEFDKAELRPEDKELLARIAGILMTSHDYTVSVNGHTDDVGSAAYNQALSERRARAVHDYLVKAGLPAEILSVQGHGKSRPLVPGTSEAARAKNRRVELGIVNTQIRYAR